VNSFAVAVRQKTNVATDPASCPINLVLTLIFTSNHAVLQNKMTHDKKNFHSIQTCEHLKYRADKQEKYFLSKIISAEIDQKTRKITVK